MKMLVLGGSGMLGHQLWQTAAVRGEAYATVRGSLGESAASGVLDPARTVEFVAADDFSSVVRAFDAVQPTVVANCIGVVKQRPEANDPLVSITINSLFPHQLARLCRERAARLIHVSTDCVFSGQRGAYTELDVPDPEDLYGRSKLLGEVMGDGCLTLRSSMIGRELQGALSLLEWFLAQRGVTVRGYSRAYFSGLTTPALSRIICDVAEYHPDLHGVWHVAAAPISKLALLRLVRDAFGLDVTIEVDDLTAIDRTLNGQRFEDATGFVVPDWPTMIRELAAAPRPTSTLVTP
jgi:dTDP-4-dehydrorhamnose reductase